MEPIEVLLVESYAGDTLLTSQILANCPTPVNLHVARDGLQAILMLSRGTFHPDLVILELSIPEISGHDVLERYHPKEVPVVVFTSYWNEADQRRAFALGAREYIQKPRDLDGFRDAVLGIIQRWGRRGERGTARGVTTF